MLVTLWESMLDGRIAPAKLNTMLFAALPGESDELNTNRMLDYERTLFWRFTAATIARPCMAPKLEALLRAGLERAASTSRKAAWFGALRSVALTETTLHWLELVWTRDVTIPKLPLANQMRPIWRWNWRCATCRTPKNSAGPVRSVQERRPQGAVCLRAAGRLERSHRARAIFTSLKDVRNRSHESWVLEGAGYLHHPLRAATSRMFVLDALDLVREIQRTGDIFFPKRWADATLSGYQSPQTAAEVRQFIDELRPTIRRA
jgi:aminopeptidase N